MFKEEKDTVPFKALINYLADRGITEQMCNQLGFEILTTNTFLTQFGQPPNPSNNNVAIHFKHCDLAGVPLEDWGTGIEMQPPSQFNPSIPIKRKPWTVAGRGSRVWFHPLVDWANPPEGGFDIDIHESVLKASLDYELTGKACIGLNGVNTGAPGGALQPMMVELFTHQPIKRVRIIFDDHDPKANISGYNVELAQVKLVEHIRAMGIEVFTHNVPESMDDLNTMWRILGPERVVAWLAEEGEVGKYSGLTGELKRLNGEVVLIENGSYLCEVETGIVMTASQFKQVNYADRIFKQMKLDKDGNPKKIMEEIKVAEAWLAWPERRKVKDLVFKPGAPREERGVYWNAWYDDMITPVAPSSSVEEAELERMLRMMKDQINDVEVYNRLMSTLAWHVQNPGSPPMNYLVLMSTRGHTGKSLLLEGLYRPIFGKWSWSIDEEGWNSSFRPWIESQMVLYEEAFTAETQAAQRKEAAKLTSMATAKELMLNGKHLPQRMVDKGFLLAVTTNNMDGLYVTKYDRRAFVVSYGQTPARDAEVMKAETDWVSDVWMADGKGPARFLDVLLSWDCSGYNPHADALETKAKLDMQEVVKRPIEQWVGDLRERWEEVAPCRYYKSEDLAGIYMLDGDDGEARSKRSLGMAITKEMKKQGYIGSGLLSVSGNKARYYDVSGSTGSITSNVVTTFVRDNPALFVNIARPTKY